MIFILGGYAAFVWLIFFKLKLIPWNTLTKVVVSLVGLFILLFFMSLLNTRVPSGRFTVIVPVSAVAPAVSGTIHEIAVTSGENVEDGQLLYSLDERPFQFALDQAQANLRVTERFFRRIDTAIGRNSATFSQHQLDQARAGFEAATAATEIARYNLEHTKVLAVGDGQVASVEARSGERIPAFTSVMAMTRLDGMTIVGVFDQNGRPAIKVGARVGIAPRHQPGTVHWTTVNLIQPATDNAQVEAGAMLLGAQNIGASPLFIVRLDWPETLGKDVRPGLVGSAMVIGENAGAIGGLGKILLQIKALVNYL